MLLGRASEKLGRLWAVESQPTHLLQVPQEWPLATELYTSANQDWVRVGESKSSSTVSLPS